ncbi:HET-domain-containing protein [Polyplosphaeria fusca]|uniref:HET-domain-containing protein n=1 Tax=Polyplosphaeria fusca TaxID=682080 RepID=A0A9P4R5W5_9PLEO|nr:HET-domain-containing protein [Polyplosphaeria fusca]
MRLLRCNDTGEFSLSEVFANDETIPPYAILSHTWLEDAQEPTFEDLTKGTGRAKLGYKKLQFCGEQAYYDGLQYFWVDTCCINKSNFAELSQAINSMFRWYRNAARCYVYLSDFKDRCIVDGLRSPWDSELGRSKWFTRGWTLQELLAPRSLEFFSYDGIRLGDRSSLREQIKQITGVPVSALQGTRLSQFSADERFLWMERRQTKRPEDKVYSMLGILDVEIPLYYGEGAGNAAKRVQEVIDKREICLRDLRLTDPYDDKKRIENTKGGLLVDSYRWVLQNPDFQQWRDNSQSRLLWIKGDPGKGKTMVLCGIINELSASLAKTAHLCYFFCQATDSRINGATAVLRGLLFMLLSQQPSLIAHLRKKHDRTGKVLFEDANAWVALCDIFTDIVQDPSIEIAYFFIDALDECIIDLPRLLDLIVQTSSASSQVKWIMSSRNWPDIEERLERAGDKVRLSLELNADSVSAAVRSYIEHKVSQLARDKKYNDQMQRAVLDYLQTNANDTFLWAALVCQNLNQMSQVNIVKKLEAFPPGLDSLYNQMIQRINKSNDVDICRRVLATVAVVYRPVTLQELTSLVEELDGMAEELGLVRDIVDLCGSLLTIRDGTIYFVHQSAKDFLLREALDVIFPSGSKVVHYTVFFRSLLAMSATLQRDVYRLSALGCSIEQTKQPNPDPLAASWYLCIYWIDHLCDWSSDSLIFDASVLKNGGIVDSFIRKKYLYWLEALSLYRTMSKGVVSMSRLEALIKERAAASSTMEVVRDARRFITYHKSAIESSPLQAYGALLFSPTRSVIRALFKDEEPQGIVIKPGMQEQWSSCLSTLEGHSNSVWSVAFSHDSTRLASASYDRTVKVWDAHSGECLQTVDVEKVLDHISFDSSGNYLNTDGGVVSVSAQSTTTPASVSAETRIAQYQGIALDRACTWITYNSQNLLKLPSEYRPSCSKVLGNVIALGVGNGRVWMCEVGRNMS